MFRGPRLHRSLSTPATSSEPTAEGLYISPKNGQTAKQMWVDLYTCSGWAKSQSGFDPADLTSGAAPNDSARRNQLPTEILSPPLCSNKRISSMG